MSQLICLSPHNLPQGAGQGNLGIYIKSIVRGGPADMVSAGTFLIQLTLRYEKHRVFFTEMT